MRAIMVPYKAAKGHNIDIKRTIKPVMCLNLLPMPPCGRERLQSSCQVWLAGLFSKLEFRSGHAHAGAGSQKKNSEASRSSMDFRLRLLVALRKSETFLRERTCG